MLPNSVQTQTAAASVVAGLAGFAAGHGWLGLGVGDWTTLLGAAVAVGAIVWPIIATRLQALKTQVGNSGAVVLTNRASAEASSSPNVIEATPSVAAAVGKPAA